MALYPIVNQDYANVTFDNIFFGNPPLVKETVKLSTLPTGKVYGQGSLIARIDPTTPGNPYTYTLYDHTVATQSLYGIIEDTNLHPNDLLPDPVSNIIPGYVTIATIGANTTQWIYIALRGLNGGNVDIDALITAGKARKFIHYDGQTQIALVVFDFIGK